jgi:hypothetical protein
LLWLRRKFVWSFFPALAWVNLSSFVSFLVKKSNKCFKFRRSFGSLVDEENLLIPDSATRGIGFIIRCGFRIDELLVTLRVVVLLEEFETSSSELRREYISLSNQYRDICLYRVSTMIPRTCFITSSYTTWCQAFLLVPNIEVVVDKVVVHFDEQDHVLDVRKIGSQVGICMGYECLFKGVESNNPAGGVVERIR